MAKGENSNQHQAIGSLVEKAKAGNRFSFQELVNIHQEDIYRLAYFRTFSQMDAEDLTQDVFEQAYRRLDSLQDPQKFRAWLYTIAINRCNDFLRKRKFQVLLHMRSREEQDQEHADGDMSKGYNERIEKKRFWRQVRIMLKKLSAMEREVFTLRFMDHRTIKEIAAILGKNESTVKTHLYRALSKARTNAEFFKEYRETLS